MGKDDDKALKKLDEALVESYRRMDVSMPSQYDRVRRITKTRSDLKGSDDEAVQRLEETMRRYPAYKSGGPVKKADPMKKTKYADGGTVKRSFFDEINDLGNVGRLSSMGRGMSRAEAAEETGRSQAQAAMGRAAARGEPEMAEDMSRETAREIARETRMAVPGMGAEVISPPARRAPPRQRNRAAIRARSQAASEAQMRGMTPNYSESMARGASRPLTNAEIVRRRNMPSSGAFSAYAKGGKVKLAGGGTCRGMGKATRGGDYKFR